MSDEADKIRITSEDVARAEVPASPSPPPPTQPAYSPPVPLPAAHRWWLPVVIGSAGLLIVILVIVVVVSLWPEGPTLEVWTRQEEQLLNQEFESSPKAKAYIEGIHPLVTFSTASVKSIRARTIDGSDRAGKGGKNVAELEYVIDYRWEGPINKNGYTDVLYVWDVQNNRLKSSRYLESNAVINWETIDWVKVGFELAPLIFGRN